MTFGAEENGWELKELERRARKYYESTDEEVRPSAPSLASPTALNADVDFSCRTYSCQK